MTKIDFIQLYSLDGVRELAQERLGELGEEHSRLASLEAALGVESNFEHYDIRRRKDQDVIRFSSDRYKESSPHVLLLSADVKYAWSLKYLTWSILTKRRIVAALTYRPAEDGIYIQYVQSAWGIQLEQYKNVQNILGLRPHELLVAHFIARIAPVLDMYPDMNVTFPQGRSSYSIIGERFAKSYMERGCKKSKLSPYKERVKQIFGSGSPWLDVKR